MNPIGHSLLKRQTILKERCLAIIIRIKSDQIKGGSPSARVISLNILDEIGKLPYIVDVGFIKLWEPGMKVMVKTDARNRDTF